MSEPKSYYTYLPLSEDVSNLGETEPLWFYSTEEEAKGEAMQYLSEGFYILKIEVASVDTYKMQYAKVK